MSSQMILFSSFVLSFSSILARLFFHLHTSTPMTANNTKTTQSTMMTATGKLLCLSNSKDKEGNYYQFTSSNKLHLE